MEKYVLFGKLLKFNQNVFPYKAWLVKRKAEMQVKELALRFPLTASFFP
jgi:hypothetical protein